MRGQLQISDLREPRPRRELLKRAPGIEPQTLGFQLPPARPPTTESTAARTTIRKALANWQVLPTRIVSSSIYRALPDRSITAPLWHYALLSITFCSISSLDSSRSLSEDHFMHSSPVNAPHWRSCLVSSIQHTRWNSLTYPRFIAYVQNLFSNAASKHCLLLNISFNRLEVFFEISFYAFFSF